MDPKVLAGALGLREPNEAAVLDAVQKLAADAEATKSALSDVLKALGVTDADSALAAVPELMAAKQKLADMMAELDAALTVQAQIEEQQAEADVDSALTAHQMPEATRAALRVFRGLDSNVEGEQVKDRIARLKDKRAAFVEKYPLPSPDEQHLTRTIAAQPGGAQLQVPQQSAAPAQLGASQRPGQALPLSDRNQADAIDVRTYAGRNAFEKTIAYLKATQGEAFTRLSWEDQVKHASRLRETHQVIAG